MYVSVYVFMCRVSFGASCRLLYVCGIQGLCRLAGFPGMGVMRMAQWVWELRDELRDPFLEKQEDGKKGEGENKRR